jgi:hypothetical protein
MNRKRLPPKFAQLLHPTPPSVFKVREAGSGRCYWEIEVLLDNDGVMYLDRGWEQFADAHGVQQGHFLNFHYNGRDTLAVKVFDGTTCRRHYYVASGDEDESSDAGSSDGGSP